MRGSRAESGQVLPMVALLLLTIIGMAAFAMDTSNVHSQHRKLQADLDVAVKVAASAMFNFNPGSAAYTDTVKTAIADAAQILASDGYANTLTNATSSSIAPSPSGLGFCGTD